MVHGGQQPSLVGIAAGSKSPTPGDMPVCCAVVLDLIDLPTGLLDSILNHCGRVRDSRWLETHDRTCLVTGEVYSNACRAFAWWVRGMLAPLACNNPVVMIASCTRARLGRPKPVHPWPLWPRPHALPKPSAESAAHLAYSILAIIPRLRFQGVQDVSLFKSPHPGELFSRART